MIPKSFGKLEIFVHTKFGFGVLDAKKSLVPGPPKRAGDEFGCCVVLLFWSSVIVADWNIHSMSTFTFKKALNAQSLDKKEAHIPSPKFSGAKSLV